MLRALRACSSRSAAPAASSAGAPALVRRRRRVRSSSAGSMPTPRLVWTITVHADSSRTRRAAHQAARGRPADRLGGDRSSVIAPSALRRATAAPARRRPAPAPRRALRLADSADPARAVDAAERPVLRQRVLGDVDVQRLALVVGQHRLRLRASAGRRCGTAPGPRSTRRWRSRPRAGASCLLPVDASSARRRAAAAPKSNARICAASSLTWRSELVAQHVRALRPPAAPALSGAGSPSTSPPRPAPCRNGTLLQ